MKPTLAESAGLYVLDQLDARERADFEAQLLRDPVLAARVRELESALAERVHALPTHVPSAGLLKRIEARLDPPAATTKREAARPSRTPWAAVARWGIAAILAVGVGIIAVQELRRPPAAGRPFLIVVGLDGSRSTFAELPVPEEPRTADGRFIQLASVAEQLWKKPGGLAPQVNSGYALFDPGTNQGFIAIRQLPAADTGKSYHLWVVDKASGRTREAGILPLAGTAGGLYFFSVPSASGTPGRLDFFVTAEEGAAADPDHPKGKVVLGDNRI
jgi:hypothetical protein